MYEFQKKILRELGDKRTLYYFPRAMGKTYVLKFTKELGKRAAKTAASPSTHSERLSNE